MSPVPTPPYPAVPSALAAGLALLLLLAAAPPAAGQSVRELILEFRRADARSRRLEAARLLAERGPEARGAVPILESALDDPDAAVAAAAARALGRIGDAVVAPQLVRRLDQADDSRAGVREEAARALGLLGDRQAVDPLRRVIEGTAPVVAAAGALALLQGERAVPLLIRLSVEGTEELRAACLSELGRFRTAGAAMALTQALARPPAHHARIALAGLARAGDPRCLDGVLAFLATPPTLDPEAQIAALDLVAKLGLPRAAAPLAPLASSPIARVREHLARTLERLGSAAALPPLLVLSTDANWTVRSRAASALGELDERRAGAALLTLAADEQPFVRSEAAHALGRRPGRGRLEMLSSLVADPVPAVRIAAIAALAKLGGDTAVLLGALRAGDARTRGAAAQALCRVHPPRRLALLAALEREPDAGARGQIARALLLAPDAGGTHYMEAAIERETDSEVRLYLAALLEREQPGATDKAAQDRRRALRDALADGAELPSTAALESNAASGVEATLVALGREAVHANPERRARAIAALGFAQGEGALRVLVHALERALEARDAGAQLAAIGALGELGLTGGVGALASALAEDEDGWPPDASERADRRVAVLRALGRIGSAEAANHIIRRWSDPHPRVERAARDAIETANAALRAHAKELAKDATGEQRAWLDARLAAK